MNGMNRVITDIEETEYIKAPIREVFRALTDTRVIDEWGGGPSRVQARINGRYSLWDGEMYGTIREIVPSRRLVYTLREEHWDSTMLDSLVTWILMETDRGVELSLRHTGLPTKKIRDIHEDGWGDYFIGPLKAYLENRHR